MDLLALFGDPTYSPINSLGYMLLLLWILFWKGVALWRASKYDQKYWFVALLVVNFFSVLELVYLFFFAKKKLTVGEVKSWLSNIKGRSTKKSKN